MAAATKGVFALSAAQVVAAAAGNVNSTNTYDGHTHVGIGISGTVTNVSGITVAPNVQLWGSGDNSNFYQIDQVGMQLGTAVQPFSFNLIPDGYAYLRLVYTSATTFGFTVTANAFYVATFV